MEKFSFSILLLLIFGVASAEKCINKSNSKLFCYYAKVQPVDNCKCTHVILPVNSDVKSIEKLKQSVEGIKVLVTVHEFNEGLVELLKNSKVDGLEVNLRKIDSKSDIGDFVTTAKNKLGAELITVVSVPSRGDLLAKYYDFKGLSKHVDAFVLQTDFLGPSKNHTFHPSRLSGLWDMQNADSVVDLVTGLGAPLSKLVITAPVQGYQFKLQNKTHTAVGSPALEVKSITRDELCAKMSKFNWTLERDQDQTGPYVFRNEEWIAFDDDISMDIKAKYARIRGLYGLALKDLSQDGGSDKCGYTLLNSAHKGLSKQARAPRGAVLRSLKREILDNYDGNGGNNHIQVSPYRISRIIDVEGKIHTVRQDTRTEFACSRQGYFVHPRSCNRFYRCVKFDQQSEDFNVFEFDCPAGLAFDEKVEVCVWPGSLSHGSPCSGSSEIAPVPKERYVCPHEPGYYADPENCRWFFACLDHGNSAEMTPYEFRCPFGLVFDQEKLVCEWPWLVPKCFNGNQPSVAFYGGNSLENYDGLGVLRPVTLGGVIGRIDQPVNKVYSSFGINRNAGNHAGGLYTSGHLQNSIGKDLGVQNILVQSSGDVGGSFGKDLGIQNHGYQSGSVLLQNSGTENLFGANQRKQGNLYVTGQLRDSFEKDSGIQNHGYQPGIVLLQNSDSKNLFGSQIGSGEINNRNVHATGQLENSFEKDSGLQNNGYQSGIVLLQNSDSKFSKVGSDQLNNGNLYATGQLEGSFGKDSSIQNHGYQSGAVLLQNSARTDDKNIFESQLGSDQINNGNLYATGQLEGSSGKFSGIQNHGYQSGAVLLQNSARTDDKNIFESQIGSDQINNGNLYATGQLEGSFGKDSSIQNHGYQSGAVLLQNSARTGDKDVFESQIGSDQINTGNLHFTGQLEGSFGKDSNIQNHGYQSGTVLLQNSARTNDKNIYESDQINNGNLYVTGQLEGSFGKGSSIQNHGYQSEGVLLENSGKIDNKNLFGSDQRKYGNLYTTGRLEGYLGKDLGTQNHGYQSGIVLLQNSEKTDTKNVLLGSDRINNGNLYTLGEHESSLVKDSGTQNHGYQSGTVLLQDSGRIDNKNLFGADQRKQGNLYVTGQLEKDSGTQNRGYQSEDKVLFSPHQINEGLYAGGVKFDQLSKQNTAKEYNKNFFASESEEDFKESHLGKINYELNGGKLEQPLSNFGFSTGGFSHGFQIDNNNNFNGFDHRDFGPKTVDIVGGGFSAVKNYQLGTISPVSSVSVTPSSVPTVTSVPLPSKVDVLQGGVIANVPQLQFKVQSADEVVFHGNVSSTDGGYHYPKPSLAFEEGSRSNGYHYPKPSVKFEEGGSYSYQDFNKQVEDVRKVEIHPQLKTLQKNDYGQKLDLIQSVTPSVLIENKQVLLGAKQVEVQPQYNIEVNKPVSTYNFQTFHKNDYGQKLDTIQSVTPSVLIEDKQVLLGAKEVGVEPQYNIEVEKPTSTYNFHRNDYYGQKLDTIQTVTPSVLIETKGILSEPKQVEIQPQYNIEVTKPVSTYNFQTFHKNDYGQKLEAIQSVTPSVLIEDKQVLLGAKEVGVEPQYNIEVEKPTSTFNFHRNDYYGQKLDTIQTVTPSILIEDKQVLLGPKEVGVQPQYNIEVDKPVSTYNFQTFHKNDYAQKLDTIQSVTPSVLIEDKQVLLGAKEVGVQPQYNAEVEKPTSTYNFHRNDYYGQKLDTIQSVTPSVLIEAKEIVPEPKQVEIQPQYNIELTKPVSTYNFQTFHKNDYGQKLETIQSVTPSVLIENKRILPEPKQVEIQPHYNIEVQKPVSTYNFQTFHKNDYAQKLDTIQSVTPSVLIEDKQVLLGPKEVGVQPQYNIEVEKPSSSYNFHRNDYYGQKLDTIQTVTPSVLIEAKEILPEPKQVEIQPQYNIEVTKPVSTYNFQTFHKNDYGQKLETIQSVTPSVLIENKRIFPEPKQVEIQPHYNIEVQKPVSTYNFQTFHKNDYAQKLDTIQSVTPSVLIEDKQVLLGAKEVGVEPQYNIEVEKPTSTYNFHRNDYYDQKLDTIQTVTPSVLIEAKGIVPEPKQVEIQPQYNIEVRKPVSTYDFQTFHKNDYAQKLDTIQSVTPSVLIEDKQVLVGAKEVGVEPQYNIEVEKPVSTYNFHRNDYYGQKLDTIQTVTPSVLIEDKGILPEPKQVEIQPQYNIEVTKPVSTYNFQTFHKNDYGQKLETIQSVTPSVLIEAKEILPEPKQVEIEPQYNIELQKPVSTYNFQTFHKNDYGQKLDTIQSVTPSVLVEDKQVLLGAKEVEPQYNVEVDKPVSTYNFDKNVYGQKVVDNKVVKFSFGTQVDQNKEHPDDVYSTLEPVVEVPFVKKTAYVTGDQQSNLLGTYGSTKTVLVPTTEKIFYSTPKPILTTQKSEPLKFYFYDSRLSSTSKPSVEIYEEGVTTPKVSSRKYLPPKIYTTTSKPYLEITTPYIEATSTPFKQTIVENYENKVSRRPVKILKIVRPKSKAIVKVNDFYPMLPAKLGAQCTCVSNTLSLRKRPEVKYYDALDDYVVQTNSNDYEPERVVEITQIPKEENKEAVKTGLKLIKSAAKEGTKEIVGDFDRYGPGGVRSRLETLQGIDCQRAGLFRHPTQCNKFYSCVYDCDKKKFKLHIFNCPVHLTFDNNLGACNWPSQGPACTGNTLLPSE